MRHGPAVVIVRPLGTSRPIAVFGGWALRAKAEIGSNAPI